MRADPQDANHAGKGQKDHDEGHRRPDADAPPGAIETTLGHHGEIGLSAGDMGEGLHGLHGR